MVKMSFYMVSFLGGDKVDCTAGDTSFFKFKGIVHLPFEVQDFIVKFRFKRLHNRVIVHKRSTRMGYLFFSKPICHLTSPSIVSDVAKNWYQTTRQKPFPLFNMTILFLRAFAVRCFCYPYYSVSTIQGSKLALANSRNASGFSKLRV